MLPRENGGQRYQVHCSGAVAKTLRELQRQASRTGQGQAVAAAFREIVLRLTLDPGGFGEPLYRLPALRMEIRQGILRPLAVGFGVCEDRPLVFIKSVRLL